MSRRLLPFISLSDPLFLSFNSAEGENTSDDEDMSSDSEDDYSDDEMEIEEAEDEDVEDEEMEDEVVMVTREGAKGKVPSALLGRRCAFSASDLGPCSSNGRSTR